VSATARLVCAEPGRAFALPPGFEPSEEPGHHGGAQTRDQVVAVGGGAPEVAALADAVRGLDRVDATAWAPTVAALLGVSLHGSGAALV
jgi:hypothetical protein